MIVPLRLPASTYPNLITGKDIQGTGPYKFVSWNPNQGFMLVANKNWWGTSQFGGPWLDAIQSQNFAAYDAIGLAYQSGLVDWAAVTASVAKLFQSKGQTATGHKAGLNYLGAVVTNPLLKDSRVRQALFYALDPLSDAAKTHNIGHTLVTISNQHDFGQVWKG